MKAYLGRVLTLAIWSSRAGSERLRLCMLGEFGREYIARTR